MYKKYIKRVLDVFLSLLGLIILSPILIILYFLVRIKIGKPVIFKQKRLGRNEKEFTIYKFRTMTDEKDENGKLLSDKERLVKFGKFLRSTSLDELPELINIINGDMSIVGPRPLYARYFNYYTNEERHRHDIRPGLTGLAQINGRSLLEWNERFKKDIEYVNHVSFIGDVKIVLLTIKKVIIRENVETPDESHDLDIIRKNVETLDETHNIKVINGEKLVG